MTPPLTFLEKKWGSIGSNTLITGATQTTDRKTVQMVDSDIQRTITPYGRRTLLTLGRHLYWNCSAVRGTINEMADLAVQSYIPQFEGADQAWGSMVEEWMYEHDKICDVRGWPFNMSTYRRNLVRGVLVDGDMATMLTRNADGYPLIQVFPSHRIGSRYGETMVQGGPWDGARIVDGVIVDEQGRPLAYRVMREINLDFSQYQDVPARDMFLSFLIESPDQIRGISILGASCFDWQDVSDARRFELISQKVFSSKSLIITNEDGEADETKALLTKSSDNFNTDGTVASTVTETIDGVSINYHRAGTGSKMEAFQADRPSTNQQAFRDDVIREALHGLGWSFDFSYNPTKIGGAPARLVTDRINRKLDCLRDEVVRPAQARVDGYRIASVMDNPARTDKKIVLFPFNPDWWRWTYQGPAKLTSDAKYDSDVDIQERKAGIKTLAKSAAQRGDYWRDVRKQRLLEARDLLEAASAIAKEFNISIELAISLLEKPDANPVQSAADSTAQSTPQPAAP